MDYETEGSSSWRMGSLLMTAALVGGAMLYAFS